MDAATVANALLALVSLVAMIFVAKLSIEALLHGFDLIREALSATGGAGGDNDPYAGYTAEDDARDRAAAGLGPNDHGKG